MFEALGDMSLDLLRAFEAAARLRSFTAAAIELGTTQPAVSQQIKRVEARIGMPLVSRAGRGIRLTDAGEVLARHAGAVLTALDTAAGELSDLAGLRSGRVRLSAFPSASSTIVPRLITGMAAEHEGVRFTYFEAEPPESVAAVRDGLCDLAIAFRYPADPHDAFQGSVEGLEVHELARDEVVLLAPTAHPALAEPGPVDLGLLREENWIAGCPRCRSHLLDSCARSGFAPAIAFETDNVVAVESMVAAGLGVALLPGLALAASALPAGVDARPTAGGDHRIVVAVTRPGAAQIPAVGETLRLLRATVAAHPL